MTGWSRMFCFKTVKLPPSLSSFQMFLNTRSSQIKTAAWTHAVDQGHIEMSSGNGPEAEPFVSPPSVLRKGDKSLGGDCRAGWSLGRSLVVAPTHLPGGGGLFFFKGYLPHTLLLLFLISFPVPTPTTCQWPSLQATRVLVGPPFNAAIKCAYYSHLIEAWG